MDSILFFLFPILEIYTVFTLSRISKGKLKYIVFSILAVTFFLLGYILDFFLYFIMTSILILLFVLFYDDEPFKIQYPWLIAYLILFTLSAVFLPISLSITIGAFFSLVVILVKRRTVDIIILTSPLLILFMGYLIENPLYKLSLLYLYTVVIDRILYKSQENFEITSDAFRRQLLNSQYEEIKNLYLQMRGYRHDYHSHLQTMKAYIKADKITQLNGYLNELEGELNKIDLIVNSGNPLIDAIFNSKLSLAKKHDIAVKVKVRVNPEAKITIGDTDLCIIIGNLMDNALEAAMDLNDGKFIRIYMEIQQEQFYLYIANSSKEILSFEESHYISTKRGNHGLGLKRVKLLIDNYGGYLNLQNQPSVFVSEVTIPLG